MSHRPRYRILLPAAVTVMSLFLGCWGLWQKNVILRKAGPFFEHSDLQFHVWPLPLQLALGLQTPSHLVVGWMGLSFEDDWAGFGSNWFAVPASLILSAFLWYAFGRWIDWELGRPAGDGLGPSSLSTVLILAISLPMAGAGIHVGLTVQQYARSLGWAMAFWGLTAIAAMVLRLARSFHQTRTGQAKFAARPKD
jgi:hypothetical protein